MSETITLPKSGIVLERSTEKGTHWRRYIGPFCVEVRDHGADRPHPKHFPRWGVSTGGGWSYYDARDVAVASLDDDMLKALAALLPADARERVARAISDEADLIVMEESRPQRMLRIADAGLSALVRP